MDGRSSPDLPEKLEALARGFAHNAMLLERRPHPLQEVVSKRSGEIMTFEAEMEQLFSQNGFNDFKWIDPQEIVVSQWVRMKCILSAE